jgi:NAD(P)-dependent dehydrogenase (short-subunit alcohol dehydrogenase family)
MKVALITGAGRGIGFGIARSLAAEGWAIAIMDVLPEADVAENLAQLKELGAGALYCRGDVTSAADRESVLAAIREKFGGLNLLVNNAGVAPKVRADILEASEESFERLIRINLQGPYFLTQLAANWMIEQGQADPEFAGCIVNISSISATVASPSRGDYCISKAGISMATKLFAARLGEFNIPVYEIRPGVIKTDMTAVVQEKYDKLIAEGLCLQERWGFPEDIGKAVAMLARGDLPYSTGQVIMIDGGLTLQRL